MKEKIRLDHLLVQRGLAETGARAQALLLAGKVRAPGLKKLKPGEKVSPDQPLELIEDLPYVSRGGQKLEGALDHFKIDPRDRHCLDVGASTGGFTDCLLQRGAKRVLAIDVGHGQLHEKLRADSRVENREKTHILKLDAAGLAPFFNESTRRPLVTVDVSFISLEKVLPHLARILPETVELVCLIKPQFEASPAEAPKGVVRKPEVRERIVKNIEALSGREGFTVLGAIPSPLKGPEGNVEFLMHLVRNP